MKTQFLRSLSVVSMIVTLGAAFALADDTTTTTTHTTTSGETAKTSTSGDKLTDPQIAAVALAAHEADIDAGKVAESKATSAEVKKFAKEMVRDHSAAKAGVMKLAHKLKVKPEESSLADTLKTGGKDNVKTLKSAKKGADFDKAYIDHEVAYHQTVLDAINNTLIPAATNDQLKTTLEQTKASVEHHLQMAKDAQSSLNKT